MPDDPSRRGRRSQQAKGEPILPKKGKRRHRITPASEMPMLPLRWFWEEGDAKRIPMGMLTLTAGHGDVGKTSFNIWLVARVTRGELPGMLFGKPRNCYIAAAEDSWKYVIGPRLVAAGADLERVFHLDVVLDIEDEEFEDGVTLSLPSDFGLLKEAIREKNAAVVYFDSLMSTVELKLDTHKGRDARVALQPLGKVADETECLIIGTCHFNKASSADPAARLLGSVEFMNVPRAVIYFAHDKEDDTRVLSRGKGNLGPGWPPLEYKIEEATFQRQGHEFSTSRFVLGDEASQSADDILRAEGKGGGVSSRVGAAIWMADYFNDHDDPTPEEVKKAGAEEGYSERTIEKAKKLAGVTSYKTGGKGKPWRWTRNKSQKLQLVERGDGNDE